MEEIYKTLIDFPAYRISNFGNIQSRWQRRKAFYKGFRCTDVWKDLPQFPDKKGYLQVHLCDGYGTVKTVRIHNLVAYYFISERPQGKIIRHLDSNPSNNKVSNLQYGSYLDNENDKINNGTWNTRNGGAKVTPIQVKEIRVKLKEGLSQKELAIEYNVSRPTITRIANNTIWKVI